VKTKIGFMAAPPNQSLTSYSIAADGPASPADLRENETRNALTITYCTEKKKN